MIREKLKNAVRDAAKNKGYEEASFSIERPEHINFGDFTSNIALVLGSKTGKSPREIAEELVPKLEGEGYIKSVQIASPGFINFHIEDKEILNSLIETKKGLDNKFDFSSKKINVEFISANPTGPLHVGNGRGGVYGDILANVLEIGGAKVTREYIINDSKESAQIRELGKTALGKGDSYKSEELEKILLSKKFKSDDEAEVGYQVAEEIQKLNENFIESELGIKIDEWYSEERKIHKQNLSSKKLKELKGKGLTYENEGAVWLKTSEFGDDKDCVVVRSDGTKTYILTDIAYHEDKYRRGFDSVIDIWGADHHGHVKRMMAVKKMLDWKGELEIFITQLVTLKEGGEKKKMSKRAGTAVTLKELKDDIGVDALRWFFAEKTLDTHMELDIELAKKMSDKNPVYYVQYAHARMNSILKKGKNRKNIKSLGEVERKLAYKVTELPEVIEDISKDYQINRLTHYAHDLATSFSGFYRDAKVIDSDREGERLELVNTAKIVLGISLALLGINAPNNM